MYDQLGSWYSDSPDFSDPKNRKDILNYDYFLNEVDEVREKLGLDNFYLIGQSWVDYWFKSTLPNLVNT